MPKVYHLRKEQLHKATLTDRELREVQMMRDGYFVVTHVHRDDLKALGFKKTKKISDSTMVGLASKMADDYCDQLFHSSLRILAEDIIAEDLATK